MMSLLVLAAVVVSQAAPEGATPLTLTALRCEGERAPLAVSRTPRFSWQVEGAARSLVQSAWQVQVATSVDLLAQGNADLWDSGKLPASEIPTVTYGGAELISGAACVWRARSWNEEGGVSTWSSPATFEVGPLTPDDWAGARWIDAGGEAHGSGANAYDHRPAPLMRREFELARPVVSARLHVAGLGICLPSLNGQAISEADVDPTWTAFAERVLFRTHDVTDLLQPGANCLGLELGNGWYNPLPLRMWGRLNLTEHLATGPPSALVCLQVTHADGTTRAITSGPDWKTASGPTLFDNLYLGEVRDERLLPVGWNGPGFADEEWSPVHLGAAPSPRLRPLSVEPVRAAETVDAVSVTRIDEETVIVDFGRNLTGVPEVQLAVAAGTELTFRYGELLHGDGTLNPMTSVCGQIKGTRKGPDGERVPKGGPGAPEFAVQQDVYTARGGGERYRPKFTFHGFRYMEVKGAAFALQPSDCRALLLRTDLESAGSFSSSSTLLNRIQEMCRRTFLANVVGVQSDCPHRERFAYGGDIVATSEAFLMNFDMSRFYAKTVRDWADSARPDGRFTDTAPFVGIDYCGVGWAMVHPLLLEQLDQHYGDRALLEEQFPAALSWLEVEAARRKEGLVTTGLGDHEGLQKVGGAVLTTPMFVDAARRVARLAKRLGREDAAGRCSELAEESLSAWRQAFAPRAEEGVVGSGTQSELVFALGYDVLAEGQRDAVFAQLVASLEGEDGPRLQTGIFGTQMLLEELSRGGRSDLALALATRETFPSWGWMLASGATTLWEHWEGSADTFSNNHPMFGSISAWLYRWLGGIQPAEDAVGLNRVVIRPQVLAGIDHVESSHAGIRGQIRSSWRRVAGGVRFEIVVPPDTYAIIEIRAEDEDQLTEGGGPLSPSVDVLENGTGTRRLGVGSGRYVFELR